MVESKDEKGRARTVRPFGLHHKVPNSERPSGARNRFLREHRQKLRDEAKNRQATYDTLTVAQKLERITQRPGKSQRELTRLLAKA